MEELISPRKGLTPSKEEGEEIENLSTKIL